MKYKLWNKAALGKAPKVDISDTEYSELKKARNTLINALAIEEKYEIVISNYFELEQEILKGTTIHMVREDLEYTDFFKVRLALNVRIVNLLTAVRLYLDQLNQNVSECLGGNPTAQDDVRKLFKKEYDEKKYYRFMEALRNYVQHRGIPVHLIQHGNRWTSLKDDGYMEYSLELLSQRSYLKEDKKMKKSVLAEIEEKVDLKAATRSYIESLSYVHNSARNMIAGSATSSRKLIEEVLQRYSEKYNNSSVALNACKFK